MATIETKTVCFHCGDTCENHLIELNEKSFCCQGCLNVYQLLNQNNLEEYYCLNEAPGQKMGLLQSEKFAFLEEESIIQKILLFRSKEQAQVDFYLPQMHCSSCLWLLENLSKVNENIIDSRVSFHTKTVKITFKINQLNLRQLAELLTHIGYEPIIDLNESKESKDKYNSKRSYLKLGITGFCFANIMMIAFPEYLGLDPKSQPNLANFFKYTNVFLSLPVVFYGAQEFFVNAWYSIRQRYLNIDAPIAIAVGVTFLRSLYEVFTNTGAGFFDSMSGIVFFMLLGRTIQNRNYSTLKFNRDYKSYFPIAVSKVEGNGISTLVKLEEIEEHDVLKIHHQEVIPTDCLLSKGNAKIDYSFVTGEDQAEMVDKAEIIYAGGRNAGESIEVVAVKPFNQNSFTQLWNNKVFDKKTDEKDSRITVISKYFSIVVFIISLSTFLFWKIKGNSELAWQSATAVLIIACPCVLLLAASFTNGYLLERFSKVGVYLKNASVLENLTKINFIAFDKTGTLTEPNATDIKVLQMDLNENELSKVLFILSQSIHPLSRAIVEFYKYKAHAIKFEAEVKEIPGKGMEAWIDDVYFKIGSASFTNDKADQSNQTLVNVSLDGKIKAKFTFEVVLIPGTKDLINTLSKSYKLSLISGDNTSSKQQLSNLFGDDSKLHYHMKPEEKLSFVKEKQDQNNIVMMIGDGLNDAGALQQSNIGISVVKSAFAFSPSCDIIMDVNQLQYLPTFLNWAKGGSRYINYAFAYAVIFNLIGLGFAITGNLVPLVAAIIMPLSSLGIILIAYLGINALPKIQK
ncbi:MAG TPA: heavy metal translocating P-type ATPase metal-binding domain-containing protein [Edaphocola sp.]|nr:heavy metal translocating P-type ATPase metal-binding domain-containing protein [Edaphocola sp.]